MALIQDMPIDLIQILSDRQIQVRQIRRVVDDETGEVVATGNFHRFVLDPGVHEKADVTQVNADLGKVVEGLWTPDVVMARKKFIQDQEARQAFRDAGLVAAVAAGRIHTPE